MEISPGSKLGPYEIVSRLGAGGMGEVWRARDTRLDRSVAIKVLPEQFAKTAALKIRFEREAKTISQLNHPNICTLYDVGDDYLVMELLEGESLAARLSRGPLSLADTLRYGAQVADALERAHRAGIVHRDLKPGNVMITKSGAKLLDFGLAKTSAIDVNPDAPTVQAPLTAEGAIVGTFQYMAPEQLEGEEVDARTDIFALGALLYEMATGRRAFQGKTRTSLIAAIVASTPQPMSEVQELTPPALEHVVARCLEKKPDDRWQNAHDIAEQLRWIATSSGVTVRRMPARGNYVQRILIVALALFAATAIALLVDRGRPAPPTSFEIMAPRGYWFREAALSPNGQTIVMYAGNTAGERGLWVRDVASISARPLLKRAVATAPTEPFWSADGKWIAFWTPNEDLMKVSITGGEPQLISRNAGYGWGAAWLANGTILFVRHYGEGVFKVPAGGGEAVAVTELDRKRGESAHGWPVVVDSDRFLFTVRVAADKKNEIHAASLREGRKGLVFRADSVAGIWKSWLVFTREGAMYAQTFDKKNLKLSGEPQKIADGVWYSEELGSSRVSLAKSGEILYLPMANELNQQTVSWYDRAGRKVERVHEDVAINFVTLSPDERRLAVVKLDARKGASDIYSVDLERGVRAKVTGGLADHEYPVWAPAGDRLFFASDRGGAFDVYSQAEDGATPAELLWKTPEDKSVLDITPDGKYLLVMKYDDKTQHDVWLVPTTPGEKPRTLLATDAEESLTRLSPDGKWIAYQTDQSGHMEINVRPFPAGRAVQVSVNGGHTPQWSRDGTEVFYHSQDNNLMAAAVRIEGGVPRPAKPSILFPIPRFMGAVHASMHTDRFLAYETTDPTASIRVANYLRGWESQLGK